MPLWLKTVGKNALWSHDQPKAPYVALCAGMPGMEMGVFKGSGFLIGQWKT